MVEREVLPGGPQGPRGPVEPRTMLVIGGLAALLLLVVLGWFLLNRDDGVMSADSTSPTEGPSRSTSASGSPTTGETDAGKTSSPAKGQKDKTKARATSASPTPLPQLAPDATFTNTCRYVLGDSSSDPQTGRRFVAQSIVKNTGNTGIEVELLATWEQGEADSVTETKRARVDWRKSKTVTFSIPATEQQIEQIRSHTGPEPNCRVTGSIVLTYGDLH